MIEPAVRGQDLVLTPHILADHVLLDMDGIERQPVLGGHHTFKSIKSVQQPDGERRARPEPGTGRQIAIVMDLHPLMDVKEPERFTYRRMVDVINALDMFHLGIRDPRTMLKKRREIPRGNITIFVDGRGQDRAGMRVEPGRIIGPSAKE